jgi:hypothetical protein
MLLSSILLAIVCDGDGRIYEYKAELNGFPSLGNLF